MNCREFREKYSDYADGLLAAVEAAAARAHLEACEECRRLDAAFRAGVKTLRGLPAVGMSRGFGPRLRSRLRREFSIRAPVVANWSGTLGTLLLVAMVGVVVIDLVDSHPGGHDTLASRGTAAWPSERVEVPVAVGLHSRTDSDVVPPDEFHPLESVLIQSVLSAAPAPPLAVGGDHPRYDLSVVWGGR